MMLPLAKSSKFESFDPMDCASQIVASSTVSSVMQSHSMRSINFPDRMNG